MSRVYTIDEVHEMLINYSNHKAAIYRMEQARHDFVIGPKAQSYGIEAAMPKAQGGTPSDQVYEQAYGLLRIDEAIQEARSKVQYIDTHTPHVTGHEKRLILQLIKDGSNYKEISRRLTITEKAIRDNIKAIVWDML